MPPPPARSLPPPPSTRPRGADNPRGPQERLVPRRDQVRLRLPCPRSPLPQRGIIGLGEDEEDRVGVLHTLATLPTHPESVPINALVAVKGTPLQDQKPVEIWEMVRMIATAQIVMPKAMVRLSAGRVKFFMPEQALCFLAGANSIIYW